MKNDNNSFILMLSPLSPAPLRRCRYSRDFVSKALRQQHASATDADAKVVGTWRVEGGRDRQDDEGSRLVVGAVAFFSPDLCLLVCFVFFVGLWNWG